MAESLPFINSTGLVSKILDQIIQAQTPDRYTQDFQSTVLGYGSGSARPFIPLLKRIGFISSDGSPTELYKEFRSGDGRGLAMATAIRRGYEPLYKINEYVHKLDKSKLRDAIIRCTGADKNSGTVTATAGTFEALKEYADFEANKPLSHEIKESEVNTNEAIAPNHGERAPTIRADEKAQSRGMNLSYTINLNLPASKDPEVFDAIFKSLRENLLN